MCEVCPDMRHRMVQFGNLFSFFSLFGGGGVPRGNIGKKVSSRDITAECRPILKGIGSIFDIY